MPTVRFPASFYCIGRIELTSCRYILFTPKDPAQQHNNRGKPNETTTRRRERRGQHNDRGLKVLKEDKVVVANRSYNKNNNRSTGAGSCSR
jgi:hypothetical protein